jgi:hypothetical protein
MHASSATGGGGLGGRGGGLSSIQGGELSSIRGVELLSVYSRAEEEDTCIAYEEEDTGSVLHAVHSRADSNSSTPPLTNVFSLES